MIFSLNTPFDWALNHSEWSRCFLVLGSTYFSLLIIYYAIKLVFNLSQGIRLYFVEQLECRQPNFNIKYGKWAVITGATDGIGQALAADLARRSMSILVLGRSEYKLEATKRMLEAIKNVGQVETCLIDLADSSMDNFARIEKQISPMERDIGILINNAGILPQEMKRFNSFQVHELVAMANVHMLATIQLTRMILPGMVERRRGLVMNVSSIITYMPAAPYINLYRPTKVFLDNFTQQLQLEYERHPVEIVLLTPGPVKTKPVMSNLNWTNPNVFYPTPETYARTTLNALAAGYWQLTGNMMHGLMGSIASLTPGLWCYKWLPSSFVIGGRHHELSPVLRHRKLVNDKTNS